MEKEACCVVSERCTHPWNLEPLLTAPYKCCACGHRVCGGCSIVLLDTYSNRHVRVCLGCIERKPERFGFKEDDYDSIYSFWLKYLEKKENEG